MDAIRLFAWFFSIAAHVTAGWLLLADVSGSANDAGSGADQFVLEHGVGVEDVVTFGDAAETVAATEESLPIVRPATEDLKEVKEEAPTAIATSADSPETTVAAQDVQTEEQVKAEPVPPSQPVQAAEVEQQSASSSQSGGLATILTAYYGSVSRAFERHKAKPRTRLAGVVVVRFSMEPSGRVTSREIETSSGSAMLDDAALASVDRASPLPPVPPEIVASRPLTFSVPFRFIVR